MAGLPSVANSSIWHPSLTPDLPWDILYMSIILPSLSSFSCVPRVFQVANGGTVNIPMVSCFKFHFQHHHCSFLCWQFPLPSFYDLFLQNIMRFITGGREPTELYSLLSELKVPWPINKRLWRSDDWSQIMMHIWYIHNNLWTETLAEKFALYVITVNTPCKLKFEMRCWESDII